MFEERASNTPGPLPGTWFAEAILALGACDFVEIGVVQALENVGPVPAVIEGDNARARSVGVAKSESDATTGPLPAGMPKSDSVFEIVSGDFGRAGEVVGRVC